MDRVPSSIDEGLQQMQTEARARGLLHLTSLNPAKDSMFAGNKDLETKKNSLLNKKRIQDLLED